MGSTASDRDEVTVLVTGFGPFKEEFPANPSWEIAKGLPDYLPAPAPAPSGAKSSATASSPLPPVRILVHPEAVHVNWQNVRSLAPKFWDPASKESSGRRLDLAVHIGMASSRPQYNLEHRAHRDGYKLKDVDGEVLGDEERRALEGEKWVWAGCPEELVTDVDVQDVLGRWKTYTANESDLTISEDAGHYLCDFIYYSSMSHLWRAGERRRVVFLHVPADTSEAAIAKGRELTVQLIRSVVESELAKKGTS